MSCRMVAMRSSAKRKKVGSAQQTQSRSRGVKNNQTSGSTCAKAGAEWVTDRPFTGQPGRAMRRRSVWSGRGGMCTRSGYNKARPISTETARHCRRQECDRNGATKCIHATIDGDSGKLLTGGSTRLGGPITHNNHCNHNGEAKRAAVGSNTVLLSIR